MLTDKELDNVIIELAKSYRRAVRGARNHCSDPKRVGREAEKNWIESRLLERVAGIVDRSAITTVNGMGGGQTNFDAILDIRGREVWIELQTSDYGGPRKNAQLHGQLIGFGFAGVNPHADAVFYKIMADKVYKWTRKDALRAAGKGVMDPPTVLAIS